MGFVKFSPKDVFWDDLGQWIINESLVVFQVENIKKPVESRGDGIVLWGFEEFQDGSIGLKCKKMRRVLQFEFTFDARKLQTKLEKSLASFKSNSLGKNMFGSTPLWPMRFRRVRQRPILELNAPFFLK